MTIKEIVKELNSLEILQECYDLYDYLPEEVNKKYFKDSAPVMYGIDADERRWYETAIEVYGFSGGHIGVRVVTKLYSESSSIEDISHCLKFYEMEQIQVVSYSINDGAAQ